MTGIDEAVLSSKARKQLPKSAFAIPPDRYPIHDEAHARNALSRVAQHGTPEEKAKVRAAVKRRYPNIGKAEEAAMKKCPACNYNVPADAKACPHCGAKLGKKVEEANLRRPLRPEPAPARTRRQVGRVDVQGWAAAPGR